ncbi:peroxisome membrane protein [Mrakia frigida]|uniref:peroxisomal membrane protein PEX16 n=1 Tax=Mrakia frigida TaxID=29902 RepID=UPI003FCC19E3
MDPSSPPPPPLPPLPTHTLISAYSKFLIHNASTVSSVESAIRSATYLLPGRFEGAEIASEGVHSLLSLLSSIHTSLLNTHLSTLPLSQRPQLPPPSPHERYTRAWSRDSPLYRYAARALVVLGHVQLLGEMFALRGAGKGASPEDALKRRNRRWKWLVGVEGVKTLLRLILLVLTRRPLIHPPLPQSTFDPSILLPPPSTSPSTAAPPPVIISKDPVGEILLPKTLFVGSLTPGKELVRPLRSGREVMGESLWAARGLIYVLMLKSSSPTLPVLISFLSQLLSRQLLNPLPPKPTHAANPLAPFPPPPSPTPTFTTVEREERARRSRAMGAFLFRGAVWEGITKPTLEAVARKTSKIPLIGMMGGVLGDYLPLVDEYYYYTAD